MKLLLLMLPFLGACAGQAYTLAGRVTVSTDWPAQDRARVQAGVERWPGLWTDVAPCTDGEACVEPSSSPVDPTAVDGQVVGSTWRSRKLSVIYVERLAELGRPDLLEQTVAHELGHQLGAGHLSPGTLMCADVTCQVSDPTDADLAAAGLSYLTHVPR